MMNNIGHIELSILIGVPAVIGIVLLVVYVCRYMYIIKGKKIREKNLVGILPGCFFFGLMLIGVTILIILFAKYIEPNYNTWNTIEIFFKNHSVIASIVGTMVGLGITFVVLRPKLSLLRAYIYFKGTEERLSLCVANLGVFPVHDVEVNVFWVREIDRRNLHLNDKKFQREWKTQRMDFFRPEINAIDGIFSSHNTYSCHGERPLSVEESVRNSGYNTKVLCRVQSTHSLSGLSKVYEWIIDLEKDVEGYKKQDSEKVTLVHYDLTIEKKTGKATLK